MGLRLGGGIGDNLVVISALQNPQFYESLIFNLLFYFFVTMVLLSLFLGIIVDTFGDLWDELS